MNGTMAAQIIGLFFRFICSLVLFIPMVVMSTLGALMVIIGFNRCCCWRLRSFSGVQRCLLCVGYDLYGDVKVDVICHKIDPVYCGQATQIHMKSGLLSYKTSSQLGVWEETFSINLDQGVAQIYFQLRSKSNLILAKGLVQIDQIHLLGGSTHPEINITLDGVEGELRNRQFQLAVTFILDTNRNVQVLLSHGLGTTQMIADGLMSLCDLSEYCSGLLIKTGPLGFNSKTNYFKMYKDYRGTWIWAWFDSEDKYHSLLESGSLVDHKKWVEALHIGSIAISENEKMTFLVQTKRDDYETTLTLRCPEHQEKTRKIWLHSLNTFLHALREHITTEKRRRTDSSPRCGSFRHTHAPHRPNSPSRASSPGRRAQSPSSPSHPRGSRTSPRLTHAQSPRSFPYRGKVNK